MAQRHESGQGQYRDRIVPESRPKHDLKSSDPASHEQHEQHIQQQHQQAKEPNATGATLLPTTLLNLSTSVLNVLASLTRIHVPLDHPIWHFLENHLYALPNPPPPRTRPPNKPMQVLCVGLPRSGTESLQQALITLGYGHTYHGWDIVYDDECHSPVWVQLARRKWYSSTPQDGKKITTEMFDSVLGHSTAVTDAAASCFAPEIIAAYPDAKVVLNMRRDVEGWHKSVMNTLVKANQSWGFWIASWLDRECFWAWHVYERFLWTGLFRSPDGDLKRAVERNGRGLYTGMLIFPRPSSFSTTYHIISNYLHIASPLMTRILFTNKITLRPTGIEHHAMIRGLVPKDRLLEWYIDDGWEPLCKFLGKPVPPPDVPFPHANAANGGWKTREEQCNKRWVDRAFLNLILGGLGFLILGWGLRWFKVW